jgi:tRNA dimethylallyltransferase
VAAGRQPLVVGGTGLYLQAALRELELRPPVPEPVRAAVEQEIGERGPEALHSELEPRIAATVHPHDRKRIARLTELARVGVEPHAGAEGLWAADLRHPTLLLGLTVERSELDQRIDARVEQMAAAGAAEEARRAVEAGASRTARSAIGFEEFLAEDVDAAKRATRRFARRQLTWMRRLEGARMIDRTGREPEAVAEEIVAAL